MHTKTKPKLLKFQPLKKSPAKFYTFKSAAASLGLEASVQGLDALFGVFGVFGVRGVFGVLRLRDAGTWTSWRVQEGTQDLDHAKPLKSSESV